VCVSRGRGEDGIMKPTRYPWHVTNQTQPNPSQAMPCSIIPRIRAFVHLEEDLDDLLENGEEPPMVDPDAALEQGQDRHHLRERLVLWGLGVVGCVGRCVCVCAVRASSKVR
jgi:hypothetical protein